MQSLHPLRGAVLIAGLMLAPASALADVRASQTTEFETDFIANQAQAALVCPQVAQITGGQWTGNWRTSEPGRFSICEVRLSAPANDATIPIERAPATPRLPPPPTVMVEVGPIWGQADAATKCAKAATAQGGRWTGQWNTTRPGVMSVCEIALNTAAPTPAAPKPAAPAPITPTSQAIEAGPIWNQEDALLKCPVAAAATKGRWTGQWYTTAPGSMSVCEITNLPSPPVRRVEAGPIWSQDDAQVKCPVAAAAVRGEWTGQWVTTRPSEMSVCEVRPFR